MSPTAPPLPPVAMEGGLVRHIPLAPHQLVAPITPQDDLFVLAQFGLPRFDLARWRLELTGLIERPCWLSFDDIRALPKRRLESFHQCAGFPQKPDVTTRRIGNVVWGGADLRDLLHSVGIRPEARFLWSYGLDHGDFDSKPAGHYLKDLPLNRLARGDVLLAYEINGEPLTQAHGFPLRLVIPGYYGTNSVKWLYRLDLADRRADGIFTTILYNDPFPAAEGGATGDTRPVWAAPPEAAIVVPQPQARLACRPVEIWGWAWAEAGVTHVEISADQGESWFAAALQPRSQWSWQRFSAAWQPPASGRFTLMARATDTAGATQPMGPARNTVHAVEVEVEVATA